MRSYIHSASQSGPIISANCTFQNFKIFYVGFVYFCGDRSGMDKFSSATCPSCSDVVKGDRCPTWLRNIRKRTKKKPWKGQSRSWRFSFHKYFTTFFCLFFLITLLYQFFLYFFHPQHLPTLTTTSTTHTLYVPTTLELHSLSREGKIWRRRWKGREWDGKDKGEMENNPLSWP